MSVKRVYCNDDNIQTIRVRYPDGLHFVVGDIHGEWLTLQLLMEKIRFSPDKDHVYFVGDYNAGGDPGKLLLYLAAYYQSDWRNPGFHLIRGNHERELWPIYPLENLPDLYVIKGSVMNYYIAHAGMVSGAMKLIMQDTDHEPECSVHAYRLDSSIAQNDAPFRQLVWSKRGLYSQRSHWGVWPTEEMLSEAHACIIHGHTPYCFFMDHFSYGDDCLFWEKQHVYFSEDLQSFNLDSNIKGRNENGETYRGLCCLCLEICEEIASRNHGRLSVDSLSSYENGVFSMDYAPAWGVSPMSVGDPYNILNAAPHMKTISLDQERNPVIFS